MIFLYHRSVKLLNFHCCHGKRDISRIILHNIVFIRQSIDEILIDKSKGFDLLLRRRLDNIGSSLFQTHHGNGSGSVFFHFIHPGDTCLGF